LTRALLAHQIFFQKVDNSNVQIRLKFQINRLNDRLETFDRYCMSTIRLTETQFGKAERLRWRRVASGEDIVCHV
jgi:hypothetical protein